MAFKRLPLVRKLFKEHSPKIAFRVLSKFDKSAPVGDRGINGGGTINATVQVNNIEYITISTIGNAQDFGDLTITRSYLHATSNGGYDRGIFGGGRTGSNLNIIEYVTISSTGNAIDLSDLTVGRRNGSCFSNHTNQRGIFAGGDIGSTTNSIDYITINTSNDAQDFGDLTLARQSRTGVSNFTNDRGLAAGGNNGSPHYNTIDYITISSLGDAIDFGDLTVVRMALSGCSNGTNERGIFAGGYIAAGTFYNTIDYVTISSLGNAQDFGDLGTRIRSMSSTSNGVNDRGVFFGGCFVNGTVGDVELDTIDYITISSLGNSTEFGDIFDNQRLSGATSNA